MALSYVSRAGGDEGGQGWDGRTVLREMWGRQERRKTGRRRQETEEGGKDYQMRRWKSCGQHLTPDSDKGKRGRERFKMALQSTYNRASDVCMYVSHVLDRKLLERLMSPSPKSQVMFAPAFSWIGDFFEFLGFIFFKLWRIWWI